MEFAFYRGPGGLFTYLIRLWTRSPHSHVEVRFSLPATQSYTSDYKNNTPLSFSSSEQDKGVRFKHIAYRPERWDFLPSKDMTTDEEVSLMHKCEAYVGKEYDWLGIGGFLLQKVPIIKGNPNKWFCSKMIGLIAGWVGLLSDEWKKLSPQGLAPGELYKKLKQKE